MRYTLKQLTDFCYEHKRSKGFKRFAWEEIGKTIVWANDYKKLAVAEDDQGLCGVCIFSTIPKANRIYIHHIVAVREGFRTLVEAAERLYPDYNITGLRNSKLVIFNKRLLWATTHQIQNTQQAI